jgi:general secretion pathway protein K
MGSERKTRHLARKRQQGIALVAVVWTLVLLAVLAASFTRSTRSGSYLARNLVANAQARALADAGIHRAVAGLFEQDPERQLALDGTEYRIDLDGGEVRLRLQDEAGKIDLNRAPVTMLVALFKTVGLDAAGAEDLADAIADYRDRDEEPRPHGAEAADYKAAGLDHGPRNGRFSAIEELRQVLGMSDELYRRVKPAITVYGRGRRVNRANAPELVLRALLADDAATAVLDARSDQVRTLDATAGDDLRDSGDGDQSDPRSRRRFVRGAVTITAVARSARGGGFIREAIVRLGIRRSTEDTGMPFRILAWREGMAESLAVAGRSGK